MLNIINLSNMLSMLAIVAETKMFLLAPLKNRNKSFNVLNMLTLVKKFKVFNMPVLCQTSGVTDEH